MIRARLACILMLLVVLIGLTAALPGGVIPEAGAAPDPVPAGLPSGVPPAATRPEPTLPRPNGQVLAEPPGVATVRVPGGRVTVFLR